MKCIAIKRNVVEMTKKFSIVKVEGTYPHGYIVIIVLRVSIVVMYNPCETKKHVALQFPLCASAWRNGL